MAKTSKATKKFQNKHLKHTLEHRRGVQKHNKKIALRSKGKSSKPEVPSVKKTAREVFDDMSVEQFFEGGFEVPNPKKGTKITAEEEDEDDGEEDDESEINEQDANEDESSSEEEDDEKMIKNISELVKKDPEFYTYLKENDKALLDFESIKQLEVKSYNNKKTDEEEQKVVNKSLKKYQMEVTADLVSEWEKELKASPSVRLIRDIVAAFKTVVNFNQEEREYSNYVLNDSSVLSSLMLVSLKSVPNAITIILPYKVNLKGIRTVNDKNAHSRNLARVLKLKASAYLTLLNEITNTEAAVLILSSLQEVFPYYISHRKILKQVISAAVDVWATADLVETQVATYAFLNNVAREYPKSVLDIILRSSYSAFLKGCRTTNPHTIERLNFAKNSAAELFGINEQLSYTIGFDFVRQLAIHLRNSLTGTSSSNVSSGHEAYKAIYNWQFCHSLDFWSRVLANLCNPENELLHHKSKESPLRSLIYPLVQVTLGTIRLIPTAQFFPLRFYLIRSLIRLSQGTQVFIPVFPLLLEVLTSTAVTKPGKRFSLQAVDFEFNIKVGQQYLGTKIYQDGLSEQFLELTSEYFLLYCKSIAFPELATPAILSLRRFMKKSMNIRLNKQLQQLVEKLNANANYISNQRSKVDYGPANKVETLNFLRNEKWASTPLGQYVTVMRKTREDRKRLLRLAFEEEETAKAKKEIGMKDAIDAFESGDDASSEDE